MFYHSVTISFFQVVSVFFQVSILSLSVFFLVVVVAVVVVVVVVGLVVVVPVVVVAVGCFSVSQRKNHFQPK